MIWLVFAANLADPGRGCHRDAPGDCDLYVAEMNLETAEMGPPRLLAAGTLSAEWFPVVEQGWVYFERLTMGRPRTNTLMAVPLAGGVPTVLTTGRFPDVGEGQIVFSRGEEVFKATIDGGAMGPEARIGEGMDPAITPRGTVATQRVKGEGAALRVLETNARLDVPPGCGHGSPLGDGVVCGVSSGTALHVSDKGTWAEPPARAGCKRTLMSYPEACGDWLLVSEQCVQGEKKVASSRLLALKADGTQVDLSAQIAPGRRDVDVVTAACGE